MPPDEQDRIIQSINDLRGELKPLLITVAVHSEQIKVVEKEVAEYKITQVPKCEKKFDRLFTLVWWVLGVFLVASLGLTGTLVAKMVSK